MLPPKPEKAEEVSMKVLIPAYITSELKTAFQIGFAVFIPFLISRQITGPIAVIIGWLFSFGMY